MLFSYGCSSASALACEALWDRDGDLKVSWAGVPSTLSSSDMSPSPSRSASNLGIGVVILDPLWSPW